MLDDYNDEQFVNKNGTYNLITCPIRNSLILKQNNFALDGKFEKINGVAVYPISVFNPKGGYGENIKISTDTHSIHHYNGSWLHKEEIERANLREKLKSKYGKRKGILIYKIFYLPYIVYSKMKEKLIKGN